MLLLAFSSKATPRIFFANTRSSRWRPPTLLSHDMVRLYRFMVTQAQTPSKVIGSPPRLAGMIRSRRLGRLEMFLQGSLGREQSLRDQALVLVEAGRGHRHGDRDVIAQQVAQRDAGGANAERVLLAVESDAALAHLVQV